MLVEPSEQYRAEFLAAEDEFAAAGGERIVDRWAALLPDFAAYLQRLRLEQGQPPTEPGRVAASVFWLVDGDTYVGRVNLRHRLTPRLRRTSCVGDVASVTTSAATLVRDTSCPRKGSPF